VRQSGEMVTMGYLMELRFKMKMALLDNLPWVAEAQEALLDRWLDSVPLILGYDDEDLVEYEVAVTADLQRLTLRAAGEASRYIPALAQFFQEVGAQEAEMTQLSQLGEQLQPATLGSWLEVRPDALDGGWYFPMTLPLTAALAVAHPTDSAQSLAAWAKSYGVETSTGLGHSMGGGYPRTEIQLLLPGEAIAAQLEAGLQLFEALDAPALPSIAIAALEELSPPGLVASVWLTAEGIAKVGLLSPQPPTKLIIQLCIAAGINQDDALAAFQGTLDVAGPNFVECQQVAEGLNVEVHYRPS
jgi:hypothetical protein